MSRLVWYVGDRSPSISENITVDQLPFDLTSSTVRFKMREAGSSTLKVDQPASIVDPLEGEVRYDWGASDTDTASDYLAWWEVTTAGKIQAVAEVFIEVRAHGPDTRVLCLRADVIRLIPGYRDDPGTDGILDDLIQAESQTWLHETAREFVPIDPDPTPSSRLFYTDIGSVTSRQIPIGDAATITAVAVQDQTGTELETVALGSYVAYPATRAPWQPIQALWFPPSATTIATVTEGNLLEVTGTWGFPSVPEDVRLGVARMVLVRYIADAAPAGSALSDAMNEQGFNAAMAFASAQATKASYRIPLVG